MSVMAESRGLPAVSSWGDVLRLKCDEAGISIAAGCACPGREGSVTTDGTGGWRITAIRGEPVCRELIELQEWAPRLIPDCRAEDDDEATFGRMARGLDQLLELANDEGLVALLARDGARIVGRAGGISAAALSTGASALNGLAPRAREFWKNEATNSLTRFSRVLHITCRWRRTASRSVGPFWLESNISSVKESWSWNPNQPVSYSSSTS